MMSRPDGRGEWTLHDEVGQVHIIDIAEPRLMTGNLPLLMLWRLMVAV